AAVKVLGVIVDLDAADVRAEFQGVRGAGLRGEIVDLLKIVLEPQVWKGSGVAHDGREPGEAPADDGRLIGRIEEVHCDAAAAEAGAELAYRAGRKDVCVSQADALEGVIRADVFTADGLTGQARKEIAVLVAAVNKVAIGLVPVHPSAVVVLMGGTGHR